MFDDDYKVKLALRRGGGILKLPKSRYLLS